MKKGSSEDHSKLVNQVLLEIGATKYCRVWKNHTGSAVLLTCIKSIIMTAITQGFKAAMRKVVYISFGLEGSSDVMGILRNGKMLCIECKTGKSQLTKVQKNYKAMINDFNGIYIEVRPESLDALLPTIIRLATKS